MRKHEQDVSFIGLGVLLVALLFVPDWGDLWKVYKQALFSHYFK